MSEATPVRSRTRRRSTTSEANVPRTRTRLRKDTAELKSDDYEVGYRKPPKKTRFEPGHSGNPKGRPKGAKSLKTDLAEELQERVLVREGGRKTSLSKQRAMVKRQFEKALNGDPRATALLVTLITRFQEQTPEPEDHVPIDDDDRAILDAYERSLAGRLSQKGDDCCRATQTD